MAGAIPMPGVNLSGSSRSRFGAKLFTRGIVKAAMVTDTKPNITDEFDSPHDKKKLKINGNGSFRERIPGKSRIPPPNSSWDERKEEEKEEEEEKVPTSIHDYMEQSLELIKCADGGPPRWFCPLNSPSPSSSSSSSSKILADSSPLLLFVPGMDGTGLGLILHHETLAPLFEVRCLHIPVMDRTPFEGLLELVEGAVKAEHGLHPGRPIFLVGDSFGATLALAVAARNPSLDLVLILVNPATSIQRSPLQPLFPVLDLVPEDAFHYVPYLLSFTMGDPVRMASAKIPKDLQQPFERSQKVADSLVDMLPTLPGLGRIIPKSSLGWKLKLIRAGALYANSRLHAVKAEVLVLASMKDQMLPSAEEAKRLKAALKNCKVRIFKDSGHTLLLEDGPSLATTIKSALMYRRSKERDVVKDYVLPTKEEFHRQYESTRTLRHLVSPVFLSTDKNGQVIKDLSAIPDEEPLLFVGNHMLMGLELSLIVGEIYKQKKLLARGLAHPLLFSHRFHSEYSDQGFIDQIGLFGATPVTGKNFYKLLSSKHSVLLYPGGAREALHRRGEEYKLFWPEQSEFVRMAARFGATIIPFSCVGEDDMVELVMDYDDIRSNFFLKDRLVLTTDSNLRSKSAGEVANQPLYLPVFAPKVPGRFYCLFGAPISTAGIQERKHADSLYLKVKTQVELGISYLLQKRGQDPYRSALPRLVYEASWGGTKQGPTFDP
ncbi:acyltransferase-like protein At1g54570, chloroplastic [Selaginella moellendorffii]|nr:acyltransferase-like protein At1g54570, chloroplastic [Selaginella moellendorffii]|eukprot:XP_002968223.2 acyltransferase-like protein At1g54570, chloroplastic [Selaginella moellendorffii]